MRILLHPGFHKTGTSSLQRGAQARMDQLGAHMRLMNTSDLNVAPRAARRFSARPSTTNLRKFATAFAESLNLITPDAPDTLLISSEDLSGSRPGLRGVTSYEAAPSLMEVATATLHAHFGEAAQVTIWYTTRTPESWLRSMWYQNLRAQRLTQDFESYRPTLAQAAELDGIVAQVAERLGSSARVCATPIESCGAHPLGPLGTALDLLDVPGDDLPPLPMQNVQPKGAAEELLALNRSDLSDDALIEAKRSTLQRYRRQGQTRRDQR